MLDQFLKIAAGRSIYSTYFLLIFMVVVPLSVFTNIFLVDELAWCLLVVLALFIFISGTITLREGINSKHWPRVPAKLKYCSTTFKIDKGHKSYMPKITCTFMVNGQEFNGTEYDFSASYTRKEKALEKVDEIKGMDCLWIYYKPSDPSVNVIHPGVHSVQFIRIVVGTGLWILAFLLWQGIISISIS